MSKEIFANPWKKLADRWEKYYAPPGRPSEQDCKNYSRFVKNALGGKPGKALVLGATPEIRNLLHKFPLEVTALDINFEMISAMNQFVPKADKDILVRGSWVTNPLRDNYYDVVLGDLAWSNVPMKLWPTMNATLARLLKPGGKYIHRVQLLPDDFEKLPAFDIVSQFARLPYSHQRHFEMFIALLNNSFDPRSRTVSVGRIWKEVNKFWKNGKFVAKRKIAGAGILLERMQAFWGTDEKIWQIGTTAQLKNDLAPQFEVSEVSFSKDYLCAQALPIWCCEVNK